MADEKPQQESVVNFGVDPNKTPLMYIDSYLIGSNEHVLTLNFAQAMPNSNQHHVVSRVALTRAQAKDFLRTLNEHIEKFEV